MKHFSKPNLTKPGMLLLNMALLLPAGCKEVRSGSTLRGSAPELEGTPAQARNAANPNGPVQAVQTSPHLAQRPLLLDVDNLEPCQPALLTLSETQARSSGLRRTLRLGLTNKGPACRLGGFPAISLLGADGRVLADVQVQKVSPTAMAASVALSNKGVQLNQDSATSTPSPQIMLPGKGQAEFQIGWTTGQDCEQVSRIAVAAPGTTQSILIGRPLAVCGGEVLLTAVSLPEPQ